MLEIYGTEKNVEKLNEIWEKYKKKTEKIDSHVCEAMIKGLFNCEKKDEAKKVLLDDFKTDVVLAVVYRTFLRLYLKMVQGYKIERPEITLTKAIKRVVSSLEGIEVLDPQEVKKLETLIKSV